MKTAPRKLQIILKSSFDHEIQLAKNQLEANGIPSFIKDGQLNNTIGTSYVEQIKLMVDISDVDRALAILADPNS